MSELMTFDEVVAKFDKIDSLLTARELDESLSVLESVMQGLSDIKMPKEDLEKVRDRTLKIIGAIETIKQELVAESHKLATESDQFEKYIQSNSSK